MPSHYEETLERDINRIRGKVSEMAKLAEDALTACIGSLVSQDRKKAYSVILRDRRIEIGRAHV